MRTDQKHDGARSTFHSCVNRPQLDKQNSAADLDQEQLVATDLNQTAIEF